VKEGRKYLILRLGSTWRGGKRRGQ